MYGGLGASLPGDELRGNGGGREELGGKGGEGDESQAGFMELGQLSVPSLVISGEGGMGAAE